MNTILEGNSSTTAKVSYILRYQIFNTKFTVPRVRAQKACFVLFKHDDKFPKGFIPLERNKNLRKRVERIRIAKFSAEKILKELSEMGFVRERLYPDIDWVASKIKNRLFEKWLNHRVV